MKVLTINEFVNEGKLDMSKDELKTLKQTIKERTDSAYKDGGNKFSRSDLEEQIAELAIEQFIKDKLGYDKTKRVAYKTMLKIATPIFKQLNIKHILYN